MSLKPYLSFSSGELDPILTDNVTLEKFNKGLATARNVMISKTGSIISRFSTYHLATGKTSGLPIKLYCPPGTDYVLEFGHQYVRVYVFSYTSLNYPQMNLAVERSHALVTADLENMHFTYSKDSVYIFASGKQMLKLTLDGASSAFVSGASIFSIPNPINLLTVTVGTSTGYDVDYLATVVVNGQESTHVEDVSGAAKPIVSGESNLIQVRWATASIAAGEFNEVRIYSRPTGGGAYGLLGTTTKTSISGANTTAVFFDLGQLPDYTNGVQDLLTKDGLNGRAIIDLHPDTGAVYQQRLLLTTKYDYEALIASRPGYQNNFYRDFPYAADSALLFKAGTSGKAKVLRILESDGLIVFTTNGVYTSSGLLSVNNLALERRGGWIINEDIPPLVVPGGVFFVDKMNVIRQLIFSQEILAYESLEQTIFSNHLFTDRTIESWAYQDGTASLIIVSFSDGTFATFTYSFEHQMRAWTRHDSVKPVEQIEGTDNPDRTFFVFNNDENRDIAVTLPRKVPVAVQATDSNADLLPYNAFMDNIESWSNEYLAGTGENFIFTPVSAGVWDGNLVITSTSSFNFDPGVATNVGDIFRVFDPTDGSAVDLEVLSFTGSTSMTVAPSCEFPEDLATSARLYKTTDVVPNLSHLEGETVSVMVDGSLVSSPNNDVEGTDVLDIDGGELVLLGGMRGAIIHVGRPICADVKTLNISTVEQSPTLIESVNVNKLYIRVNKTRGLYVANQFPEEADGEVDGTSVENMEALDESLMPLTDIIIGNKFLEPVSKRIEKMLPGSWSSQGQIAIRQVDPYHFEILSIIPDLEVLPRKER